MPITTTQLQLGRKTLLKVWQVEADSLDRQYEDLVTVDKTTQEFELYRTMTGLVSPGQIGDGEEAPLDDINPLYTLTVRPVIFAKRVEFSKQALFTDQYKKLVALQPQFAQAFRLKQNRIAAGLYNTGFSATTYGVNSEALFSATHSMGGGNTYANKPSTAIAFSVLGVQTGIIGMRKQANARGEQMPYKGASDLIVPVDLWAKGIEITKTLSQPYTGDNTTNQFIRDSVALKVNDYLTSATAYFLRGTGGGACKGVRMLEQMPYDIEMLPMTKSLMHTWVASQSYQVGWYDAHHTWGDEGA